MSYIEQFAIDELKRIGMYDSDDEMNNKMSEHILKMVKVFEEEGHSGFSAAYAVSILEKLLRFEPLSPLTGEDDEWNEITEEMGSKLYQNNRCSRVFKDENGAYDIDGKVFVEPNGVGYVSKDSRVYVEFPYTPKTEYVQVPFSDETDSEVST